MGHEEKGRYSPEDEAAFRLIQDKKVEGRSDYEKLTGEMPRKIDSKTKELKDYVLASKEYIQNLDAEISALGDADASAKTIKEQSMLARYKLRAFGEAAKDADDNETYNLVLQTIREITDKPERYEVLP